MEVVCLHGFLGNKSDFDFLKGTFHIRALDLDKYIDKTISEISDDIFDQVTSGEVTLIGYSFGARMAIRIFLENPNKFSKLILLAGHAGLPEGSDFIARKKFEEMICKKLKDLDNKSFFKFWNSIALFENDMPVGFKNDDLSIGGKYLQLWGLSKQKYMRDELLKYKEKVFWNFGALDKKYCVYAKCELLEFDVHYIEGAGHRLLQHEDKVIEIITKAIDD